MCQTISQGGRRCSIHQHQNIAFIKTVAHLYQMEQPLVENLFIELRREGRGTPDYTSEEQKNVHNKIRMFSNSTPLEEEVKNLLSLAEQDGAIPGRTTYAQSAIISRAASREMRMVNQFRRISKNTGLSVEEIEQKFKAFRSEVDTSRNAPIPEEYNPLNIKTAKSANLPSDKASIVAWSKLNNLVETETGRRVHLTPTKATKKAAIQAYGYDQGRLELILSSNPTQTLVYKDVPQTVWTKMLDSDTPEVIYNEHIRNQPHYKYASEEEANKDAYRSRCHACGQFQAAAHICPARIPQNTATAIAHIPAANPQPQTFQQTSENLGYDPALLGDKYIRTPEDLDEKLTEHLQKNQSIAQQNYPHYLQTMEVYSTVVGAQESWVESFTPQQLIQHSAMYNNGMNNIEFPEELLSNPNLRILTALNVFNEDADDEYYHYKALAIYDDRVHKIESINGSYHTRLSDGGMRISLRQRLYDNNTPLTEAEHEQLKQEDEATLASAVASTDSVVDLRDRSVQETRISSDISRTILTTGDQEQLQNAFADGKAVAVTVSSYVNFSYDVDTHGFSATSIDVYSYVDGKVSGDVLIRRNESGAMENLLSPHSLRCDCSAYARNYRCTHISSYYRYIDGMFQQLSRQAGLNPATRDHPLLASANLQNVPSAHIKHDDTGAPYISFGNEVLLAGNAPWEYSQIGARYPYTPEDALVTDENGNLTEDSIYNLCEYKTVESFLTRTHSPDPAVLQEAIRHSDVEAPFTYKFSNNIETTGKVIYAHNPDGAFDETVIKSQSTKCSCNQYLETYDCAHVRLLSAQHLTFLEQGPPLSHNLRERYYDLSETIRHRMDYVHMSSRENGLSREENAKRYDIEYAEQLREQQEYEARENERREAEAQRRKEEQARREENNKSTTEDTQLYQQNMMERWANVENSYTNDPQQFFNAYKKTLSRKRKGENPLSYRTENVTDGICDPTIPGSRKFGVELEFMLPDKDAEGNVYTRSQKEELLKTIGKDLHEAGLTTDPNQQDYHSAQETGWADWSFEYDGTVDGEIVSPLMSDTPEDWEQLKKVCDILKKHNATVDDETGSHVHISTASYAQSTAKHAELLRTVAQNEDILYRLATNPSAKAHRGTDWCAPNTIEYHEDIPVDVADNHYILGYHSSHSVGINFEGTGNDDYHKSHVEFRMWDGTLNPAIIQQQVALSAAITDAAERQVIINKQSTKPTGKMHKIGNSKAQEQEALSESGRAHSHDENSFKKSHEHVASFFDKIFRRAEDKEAATALFAITSWQKEGL